MEFWKLGKACGGVEDLDSRHRSPNNRVFPSLDENMASQEDLNRVS